MILAVAGRNSLAVNCLKFILENFDFSYDQLIAVPSLKDSGFDSFEPSFRRYAIKRGVQVEQLEYLYTVDELVLFSLQYDRILKPSLFRSDKLFNIHFSYLPEFKGMYPSIMPILLGRNYSGVTLHVIDDGIDTGDIIAQYKIPISIQDTAKDLYLKYISKGTRLFSNYFAKIMKEDYVRKPQPVLNSTYYSADVLDFSQIIINLKKTSFEIHNQIRAFIFPEYQLPTISGKKIVKSYLTEEKISKRSFVEKEDAFELSGIDGFKILLEKER